MCVLAERKQEHQVTLGKLWTKKLVPASVYPPANPGSVPSASASAHPPVFLGLAKEPQAWHAEGTSHNHILLPCFASLIFTAKH